MNLLKLNQIPMCKMQNVCALTLIILLLQIIKCIAFSPDQTIKGMKPKFKKRNNERMHRKQDVTQNNQPPKIITLNCGTIRTSQEHHILHSFITVSNSPRGHVLDCGKNQSSQKNSCRDGRTCQLHTIKTHTPGNREKVLHRQPP